MVELKLPRLWVQDYIIYIQYDSSKPLVVVTLIMNSRLSTIYSSKLNIQYNIIKVSPTNNWCNKYRTIVPSQIETCEFHVSISVTKTIWRDFGFIIQMYHSK